MIDIAMLADKIKVSIGLTTALNNMAWAIENIKPEYTTAYNSVLAVGEVLESELNNLYDSIKGDL